MREDEYEFGKMTPENKSEDGVVKNFKEQELDSKKIFQKF